VSFAESLIFSIEEAKKPEEEQDESYNKGYQSSIEG
jgi:hypothetical protein